MEKTEEERELDMMRDMFAGISLPGVIAKAGLLSGPRDIAREAYDIAEAMMKERTKRQEAETSAEASNQSIH